MKRKVTSMVIVTRESMDFIGCGFERCFRCDKPTKYWYAPNDVPCCQECAEKVSPEDIPTKQEWISEGN